MPISFSMSRLWKERLLDFIRFVAVILAFWSIWLALDGNTEKYNIPVIIAWFQGLIIFFIILMGEYNRTAESKVDELEKDLNRIKKE